MTPFSLLVPTFNRAALLRRLLSYYRTARFTYPIIIADSSPEDVLCENRDTIARCPELHITHRTFDQSIETFQKITEAAGSSDSDTIGLCSDDDFIATGAPARAVRFLSRHQEYVAVQGRSFIADVARIPITLSAFPQRSVHAEMATDRLRSYFHDATANVYAVHRTSTFIDILARIARFRTDNTRFEELAISGLGAIHGNIAVLNSLHLVRQSSRNRADSGSRLTGGWRQAAESESFPRNKELFREMLSEALAEHSVETNVARKLVLECFDSYLEGKLRPAPIGEPRSIQERATAMMLSPDQGRLRPVRRIAATFMRTSPAMQTLSKEYAPIEQLISQYPDGISTPV